MRGVRLDDFILLGLFALGLVLSVPICLILLFARTSALKARLAELEYRVARAETSSEAPRSALATADLPRAFSLEIQSEALPQPPISPIVSTADSAREPTPAVPSQHQPLVLSANRFGRLSDWLRQNWIYVVSAASLGLAGIFFVQYGMERGLLPPGLRVLAALVFGLGLIAAGEWIRRRHGDEGPAATILLPSVFSGAGLVSMFGAVLAARHLYGLIGPEVAFGGQLATAGLALLLGWFYGPLLAAVGLIGAALAPFVVGGGAGPDPWLYGYFALIAATGLGVDAIRRWAWVSVLALALGYGAGFVVFGAGAGDIGWIGFLVLIAVMAATIPQLALIPRHEGRCTLNALAARGQSDWPTFPTRLAVGAALVSSLGLCAVGLGEGSAALAAIIALAALAIAYLIWAERAPGLTDIALLPTLGFLAAVIGQAVLYRALFREFQAQAIAGLPPETPTPMTIFILMALAAAISFAAALRALRPGQDRATGVGFGLAAVLVAPLTAAGLELLWQPAPVIGLYPWALQVIGLAALATWLATRFSAADGDDMRRAAHATLAALSLVALALFLLTTAAALTLALAVLVVTAAALDRRFNLPEMGLFQQIGTAVLTYRLLIDPGVSWAQTGPLLHVILAFAGTIAALVAARWLIAPRLRLLTTAVLESAAAGFVAVFANILIIRWLIPEAQSGAPLSHWQLSLSALPWLILMLAQIYRASVSAPFRGLRHALAAIAGLIAAAGLASAALLQNPLMSGSPALTAFLVSGPPLIDTLFLAYAVPGLILLAARSQMPKLDLQLREVFLLAGSALLSLYAALEIRRLWQGDWLGAPTVLQGELYSYTLAMMALGAALLYQAIRSRSDGLRRIAMAVIGLTVAKVFLLDAAGLTGLTRVVSFLGLGLSLAGLAWLNRWAGRAADKAG